MKKLMLSAIAATFIGASAGMAEQPATMPVEIVTQDAVGTGADGGIVVPILTMIFLLLVSSGGNGLVDF